MTAARDAGAVDVVTDPVDARALLTRGRDVVTPALRAAVARLDPASREQTAHHLGWTGADGGGKAVRPALALLGAAAAGVEEQVAVPGAAAVELVHNFSLVHDDLMDGDTERRHRPTVWACWGMPSAVLTGDAMLALAQEVVLEAPSPHAAAAGRLLAATVRALVGGQVEDVAFETADDVDLDRCLAMAAGKTGSLLSASAAIGAVLGGAPEAVVAALGTFGAELGLAFQLVDDLLGIWGDPAVTGKPVGSDLRARKRSLPVTYAVTHGGGAGRELAAWLTDPRAEDDDLSLRRAAALVEQGGGRAWAAGEARRRLTTAEHALGAVDIAPHPRAALIALGRHLADREA